MAPVEADWSQLPRELLNLISERLDHEFDLNRFRSVCSNWRSSSSISILNTNYFPFKFPLLKYPFNIDSINTITSFCSLSKRSIFLIKPPQQDQTLIRPWLIRITQNSSDKIKLFPPLLSYNSPPKPFHYFFNFIELSVFHLATDFIVDDDKKPLQFHYGCIYPEKVVSVTRHGKKPMLLGTFISDTKPVMLKRGDESWTVIPDMSAYFGDICVFKGRPYVVDKIGRTVRVEVEPEDLTVNLVAEPLIGGDVKFLVESEGELLLVDIYESLVFSIEIFKLDEKEKKWVKLTSLGDRVLFLGSGCSVSASALDLCVSKGNCVIFIDDVFLTFAYKYMEHRNCIFHLDQGCLLPLADCPEYFNLFWPPPELIVNCCTPNPK